MKKIDVLWLTYCSKLKNDRSTANLECAIFCKCWIREVITRGLVGDQHSGRYVEDKCIGELFNDLQGIEAFTLCTQMSED